MLWPLCPVWALGTCALSASASSCCPEADICSAAPAEPCAPAWLMAEELLDVALASTALGADGACELPAGADSAGALALEVESSVAVAALAGAALTAGAAAAALGAALLLCVAPRGCMAPARNRRWTVVRASLLWVTAELCVIII